MGLFRTRPAETATAPPAVAESLETLIQSSGQPSLFAHSDFVKQVTCARCGAPKRLPSKTAYLYCDHCGSLIDYDFRLANSGTNAGLTNTVYHQLVAPVQGDLDRARAAGDAARYRELLRGVFAEWIRQCPQAVSPRAGADEDFRDRMVGYLAECSVRKDFETSLTPLDQQLNAAIGSLQRRAPPPRAGAGRCRRRAVAGQRRHLAGGGAVQAADGAGLPAARPHRRVGHGPRRGPAGSGAADGVLHLLPGLDPAPAARRRGTVSRHLRADRPVCPGDCHRRGEAELRRMRRRADDPASSQRRRLRILRPQAGHRRRPDPVPDLRCPAIIPGGRQQPRMPLLSQRHPPDLRPRGNEHVPGGIGRTVSGCYVRLWPSPSGPPDTFRTIRISRMAVIARVSLLLRVEYRPTLAWIDPAFFAIWTPDTHASSQHAHPAATSQGIPVRRSGG